MPRHTHLGTEGVATRWDRVLPIRQMAAVAARLRGHLGLLLSNFGGHRGVCAGMGIVDIDPVVSTILCCGCIEVGNRRRRVGETNSNSRVGEIAGLTDNRLAPTARGHLIAGRPAHPSALILWLFRSVDREESDGCSSS